MSLPVHMCTLGVAAAVAVAAVVVASGAARAAAATCDGDTCSTPPLALGTPDYAAARDRCQQFSDAAACRAAAPRDGCEWLPLTKGKQYCTKKLVIERLSDAEAAALDDAAIRRWGADNCARYGGAARDGLLPMVFDTFIFYNEIELLEIRLNELDAVVDFFVIVEADRTFTYRKKPLNFQAAEDEFALWEEQILYEQCELPESPPGDAYKQGWNREHAQRRCIERVLAPLVGDTDVVLLSDADELPRREAVLALKACDFGDTLDTRGVTLVQRQYAYTFYYELGMRSTWPGFNHWPGPVATTARLLLDEGTGKARFRRERADVPRLYDAGWHMSPFPFGSVERIVDKLDSWAHQEARRKTDEYRARERWEAAIARGDDCRRLDHRDDYALLPLYVRQNRWKYESVLLPDAELKG